MKKVLLLAIVALTALSMVPASADPVFTESGTIIGMAPQTKAFSLSATEGLNPCGQPDPDLGSTQGVDGHWITLPAGLDGLPAALTSNAVDADVWFYDEACGGLFSYQGMVTDLTPNENGNVPAGAAYAIVDVVAGANTSFTFTVG